MWNGVTSALFELLVRQGEISRPGATVRMTNGKAGPSQGKPSPAVTDAAQEGTRIRLVWTNLKQPAARRAAGSLKLVR